MQNIKILYLFFKKNLYLKIFQQGPSSLGPKLEAPQA